MKNITVTVDDEVYRQARIKAATWDTSVSALVRDFLIQLSSDDREREAPPQLDPPGHRGRSRDE